MDRAIACTLTWRSLRTQKKRWNDLAARAFAGREETAAGLRLTFRDEPGVRDELLALVAVETECCAWATWVLDGTVLEVGSTGDGVAVLHGMFRSL